MASFEISEEITEDQTGGHVWGRGTQTRGKIVQKMAGIEISEEITEDQLEAMSGGELLKQEVRLYRRWQVLKSLRKLQKINWRPCLGESYSNKR